MEYAGNFLSMLFIGWMSVQDFRTRTITAWLLPTIGICLLVGEMSAISTSRLLENALVNYALLAMQFFLLWLWISLRNRRWINVLNTQIGLGDIFLLICIAPAFSPFNFFLFYTLGALAAIVIHLTMTMIDEKTQDRIPLAGILGIPLILMCVVRIIAPQNFVIASDVWAINMLMP